MLPTLLYDELHAHERKKDKEFLKKQLNKNT